MAEKFRLVIDNRSQRSFYNAAHHFREFATSIGVEERRMVAAIAKIVSEEVPPIVSEEAPASKERTQQDLDAGYPHLKDSFSAGLVISGDGESYRITVRSSVPYAQWIETGTKPHIITPRNKKVLYWEEGSGEDVAASEALTGIGGGDLGGQPIFAHLVHNPGVHNLNKYAERALKRAGPIIRVELEARAESFWRKAEAAARIGVVEE